MLGFNSIAESPIATMSVSGGGGIVDRVKVLNVRITKGNDQWIIDHKSYHKVQITPNVIHVRLDQ